MIQIIADSTCDLNAELIKDFKLTILPLTITIEDKNYLDGIDLTVSDIYSMMRSGIVPKTSQIPYECISHTFEEVLKEGNDIIYIAFSSEMSGCFTFANMIAQEYSIKYPDQRIKVIDSKGGSSATGLVVLQCLKFAKEGLSFDELVKRALFMIDHVEHVFSVADLNWLAKGGRISKPLGFIGQKLKVRPWLDVENGKMIVKGMVRGSRHAVDTVVSEVVSRVSEFKDQLIAITHADDIDTARAVEEKIKALLPTCRTTICEIGGVLGVHIGIGGVGVFCFNKKVEGYSL